MAAHAEHTEQDQTGREGEDKPLEESLRAIIGRLDKEADDRVGKRDIVEKRWLLDLQQYHGRYTSALVAQLKEARKSTLYINSTRPKTNAMASRLSDMLFPTDDKNWGIQPTPVPELIVGAESAARAAADAEVKAAADPRNSALQVEAKQTGDESGAIEARMDEAKKRARAMEEEIDDHLRQGRYAAQAREIIEDACKIGSGIIKGPVVGDRNRRSWQQQEIKDDNGETRNVFQMGQVEDNLAHPFITAD